jgi:uncharacterized delta-60 repeat protein
MSKVKRDAIFGIILLMTIALAAVPAAALPGAEDASWGLSGYYRDEVFPGTASTENTWFNDGAVTPDGGLVAVGGVFFSNATTSATDLYVQKLTPGGTLDPNFGTGGVFRMNFGPASYCMARSVKVQTDGKIVIGGGCLIRVSVPGPPPTTLESGFGMFAARLNPNGTLDTSFGGNTFTVQHVPTSPASWFTYTMPAGTTFVHYPGQIESGYGGRGNDRATVNDIAIHGDGRIVLAGKTVTRDIDAQNQVVGFNFVAAIATLNPNGSLSSAQLVPGDQTFEVARRSNVRGFNSVEAKSDGSVIAAGANRLHDPNTGNNLGMRLWVYDSGTGASFYSDAAPGPGWPAIAHSIALLRSNKFVVTGKMPPPGTTTQTVSVMLRFNSNMTLDQTFGAGGRRLYCTANFNGCTDIIAVETGISVQAVQPDGKILAVGDRSATMENAQPNESFGTFNDGAQIYRFNPDGTPDRSFGDATNQQPNVFTNYGTQFPYRVVGGNIVQQTFELSFAAYRFDGKIFTGGRNSPSSVAPRLQAGATRRQNTFRNGIYSDLGNDGKADISVFRPAGGVWYSVDSFTGAAAISQFGASGDRISPADYDGDGRTDRAVFRSGTWYVQRSSDGGFTTFQWGAAGDLPRPGDFNGDGQADFAVFRPSNGTWYIYYSNLIQPGNVAFAVVQFGAAGDVPVLADFDADGRSDVSVFRGGIWYYIASSTGQIGIQHWGIAGDVPVTGDYDADSKSDIAVFRNGAWYIRRSSDGGFTSAQWGTAGDVAVPEDYDNDGRTDIGVYRNGTWYIQRSSNGQLQSSQFGVAGDTPLPAAYLQ